MTGIQRSWRLADIPRFQGVALFTLGQIFQVWDLRQADLQHMLQTGHKPELVLLGGAKDDKG